MVLYKDTEYKISSDGGVYNKKGIKLNGKADPSGYIRYDLSINGKLVTITGHLLVARCYLPGFKDGFQVNHIDGNKANNCLSNLEWVTPKENVDHAVRTGLIKKGVNRVGLRNGNYDKVKDMRIRGYSKKEISEALGISVGTIVKVRVLESELLPEYYDRKKNRETERCMINNKFTPVVQKDKDGIFIKEWPSVNGAAKELGIDIGSIWQSIRGKRKWAGGFKWERVPAESGV